MGVFFGNPSDVYAADSFNEGGYWEHKRISWVNRKFELSLSLSNLGIDALPQNWLAIPHTRFLLESLKKEIVRAFDGHELYGWKDPDNSWLLPFTIQALKELGATPTIVICVRNPVEVAKSQSERSKASIETAPVNWLRHTLSAMDDSRGLQRILVPFDELMIDSAAIVGRLHKAIPGTVILAESPVKPGLRHHTDQSLPELGPLTGMIKETMTIAKDPEGFAEGKHDETVHRLRRELDTLGRLFQAPLPTAAITVFWEGQKTTVELFPNRDWQRVRLPVPSTPNLQLLLQLHGVPGHVWVRSAKWLGGDSSIEAKLLSGPHAGMQQAEGMQCFQLSAGPNQVRTVTPGSGAGELELELFYEFSTLISASHSKVMLDALGI
jgi:hypothetical protein